MEDLPTHTTSFSGFNNVKCRMHPVDGRLDFGAEGPDGLLDGLVLPLGPFTSLSLSPSSLPLPLSSNTFR
jgi:hypothetical protein